MEIVLISNHVVTRLLLYDAPGSGESWFDHATLVWKSCDLWKRMWLLWDNSAGLCQYLLVARYEKRMQWHICLSRKSSLSASPTCDMKVKSVLGGQTGFLREYSPKRNRGLMNTTCPFCNIDARAVLKASYAQMSSHSWQRLKPLFFLKNFMRYVSGAELGQFERSDGFPGLQ